MDTLLCPRCNAQLGEPYEGGNKWFAKCPQSAAVIRVTSPIRGLSSDKLYHTVIPGQEKKPPDR